MTEVIAIVPAAGSGRRFGGNKVFAELRGLPVIVWSLKALHAVEEIVEIIPVLPEADMEKGLTLFEKHGFEKIKKIAPGGKERQESVYHGLELVERDGSLVLIHDGVRPLVSVSLIRRIISSVHDCDGVIPAFPPKDTIKVVSGDIVKETLKRESLVAVQTPQVFRCRILKDAYRKTMSERRFFTDDAAVVEHYGGRIKVVEGDYKNIKITTPEDLTIAETLLSMEP